MRVIINVTTLRDLLVDRFQFVESIGIKLDALALQNGSNIAVSKQEPRNGLGIVAVHANLVHDEVEHISPQKAIRVGAAQKADVVKGACSQP